MTRLPDPDLADLLIAYCLKPEWLDYHGFEDAGPRYFRAEGLALTYSNDGASELTIAIPGQPEATYPIHHMEIRAWCLRLLRWCAMHVFDPTGNYSAMFAFLAALDQQVWYENPLLHDDNQTESDDCVNLFTGDRYIDWSRITGDGFIVLELMGYQGDAWIAQLSVTEIHILAATLYLWLVGPWKRSGS